jgi:hypothetical protein
MPINTKKYIEAYLKIKNKNSQIIPFILNEPQQELYNKIKELKQQHKPVRILILKARQMGFSTLTEAILFKEVVTRHNVNAGIITHEAKATNNLFAMSKLYYDNLPEPIKPSIRNRNAQELFFNNENNTGLNSKITCMTAGDGAGRSGTYNFLHLSEFAFWSGDKKEAFISLMQTVPNNENSMVIIESTANGYEYFKELWDKAVRKESDFIPFFIGWNKLKEYSMPYTGFTLTEEEKALQSKYNVTLDQLEWRRWCIRNNCGGDVDVFKQEYPINPEEAFLSSGSCYFNKEKIINRINELKAEPIKGEFKYDYDSRTDKISNMRFEINENGFIELLIKPQSNYPYVIGGDTSGEGSDYFVAQVLDNTTGRQVAVLHKQFDADEYTRQVYCLGKYYNNALVGIEANFDTFPIKYLERLGYDKQFIRKKEDSFTGKINKSFGFKTDKITRPLILSELQAIVNDHIELIGDKDTLEEMLNFIKNEHGRAEAQQGSHDDLVMALAIAHYIRPQQNYDVKIDVKILQENIRKDFGASFSDEEYQVF